MRNDVWVATHDGKENTKAESSLVVEVKTFEQWADMQRVAWEKLEHCLSQTVSTHQNDLQRRQKHGLVICYEDLALDPHRMACNVLCPKILGTNEHEHEFEHEHKHAKGWVNRDGSCHRDHREDLDLHKEWKAQAQAPFPRVQNGHIALKDRVKLRNVSSPKVLEDLIAQNQLLRDHIFSQQK